MSERRQDFRLETSKLAKIILAEGEEPISCILHDISGSGGCLEVSESVQLPETFHLVPDDGEPSGYPCRIVWRKESRVGIRFDH
jgi:PilZ domain